MLVVCIYQYLQILKVIGNMLIDFATLSIRYVAGARRRLAKGNKIHHISTSTLI